MAHECECSEEYGPCEDHGAVEAQREGASTRTADDLSVTFIEDAVSLGVKLSPYGRGLRTRARNRLEKNRRHGVAWLNDENLQDEVSTVVNTCETDLSVLGMSTWWDDGYRIIRQSKDCPLN